MEAEGTVGGGRVAGKVCKSATTVAHQQCASAKLTLPMHRAAIVSKPQKPELASILPELLRWLGDHDYDTVP